MSDFRHSTSVVKLSYLIVEQVIMLSTRSGVRGTTAGEGALRLSQTDTHSLSCLGLGVELHRTRPLLCNFLEYFLTFTHQRLGIPFPWFFYTFFWSLISLLLSYSSSSVALPTQLTLTGLRSHFKAYRITVKPC